QQEPSKSARCRGPESNWRHMVLQVMFLAVRELAPERNHHDAWLSRTTKLFNARTASRLFRPGSGQSEELRWPSVVGPSRALPPTGSGGLNSKTGKFGLENLKTTSARSLGCCVAA